MGFRDLDIGKGRPLRQKVPAVVTRKISLVVVVALITQ